MAIPGLPTSLASLATTGRSLTSHSTPSAAQSVAQRGFARDVAQLQQDLQSLQIGEGGSKIEGAKVVQKAGKASEASQAPKIDISEVQKLAQLMQKIVHLPKELLSRLQGPDDASKAPLRNAPRQSGR